MAEAHLTSESDNIAGRLGEIDRDGDRKSNKHIVRGAERICRDRRPNVCLDLDAVNAERLVKLKRSRSGHQGHLTDLCNKISILLSDTKYAREVKKLRDIVNRQWERFALIHDEILACTTRDTLAVENARVVYGEQSRRRTKVLDKISRYLELCEDTRKVDKSLEVDYETRSEVSIESNKSLRSSRSSVKTNSSTRSFDARLKREKAELALDQLRQWQNLEKEVEQHMLELRQIVELRKLEDNIELAKLEERFVDEYEQNMFDNNELTNINTPLEFGYASPRTATLEETKGGIPRFKSIFKREKAGRAIKSPCIFTL